MRLRDLIEQAAVDIQTGVDIAPSSVAKSLALVEEASTDVGNMSASAMINTDAIDYQNEVILAGGVRLSNYVNNPAVLWEHGMNASISFPIGSSESPDGELHVTRSDYEIQAKSFFSKTYKIASQVFGLIHEGCVRATSIQVVPTKKAVYADKSGHKFDVTEESDMAEWSWCCLGVNPEAVKKSQLYAECLSLQTDSALAVLETGSLGMDRLMSPIRKSLTAMIPAATATSPGLDFTEPTEMALKHLTASEGKKLSRDELTAIVTDEEKLGGHDAKTRTMLKSLFGKVTEGDEAEKDKDDDEEKKKKAAEAKAMADKEKGGMDDVDTDKKSGAADDHDDDKDEESDDDDKPKKDDKKPVKKSIAVSDMKPGARRMSEFRQAVVMLTDQFGDEFENKLDCTPAVKSMISTVDAIRDEVATIDGAFEEAYPEYTPLSESAAESDPADSEFGRQLKSLLAADQRKELQAKGMLGVIRRASECDELPEHQRKSLSGVFGSLGRFLSEAKSFTHPMPEGAVSQADHEAALAEVTQAKDAAEAKLVEVTETVQKEMLPAS